MTTNITTIVDTSSSSNNNNDLQQLERKITIATDGLQQYFIKKIKRVNSIKNIETICDYIIAINAEINPSLMHKANQITVLCQLSQCHHNQKLFSEMTQQDILAYLDSMRRPDEADPYHKWIGTYNLRRIYLLRFFKWLYSPTVEPSKRSKPQVIYNIPTLRRKEQSTIKPSDLWIAETDDTLFLKYCPSKRDKAYHAIARDSSCRPSEILGLRIRDVIFKSSNTSQYAEIVVNGKTGNRSIPLFSAIPYIKDWIDDHPQGRNPNAFLIPSLDRMHKRFGNRMKESSLNLIYRSYKVKFFPALLEDPKVPPEDKIKIRELLRKPFNPYIFRHSALTVKSTFLKEHVLRQHAGWSSSSQVPRKYLHYFGNESNESLLMEYGIINAESKGNQLLPESLKPRICPNCSETNIHNCKFCAKCRMILTYDAYEETLQEQKTKDNLLTQMQQQIAAIQEQSKQDKLDLKIAMMKMIERSQTSKDKIAGLKAINEKRRKLILNDKKYKWIKDCMTGEEYTKTPENKARLDKFIEEHFDVVDVEE